MALLSRTEDRAQLMLVAALGLATVFVLLAAILNGVVYTETTAVRGDEVRDSMAAIRYEHDARAAVGELAVGVAAASTSVADARSSFRAGVDAWDAAASRRYGARGAAVETTLVDATYEVRAAQTNDARELTDDQGDADWTLASDVEATPRLTATVDEGSLVSLGGGGATTLVVTDGAGTWEVRFFRSLGTVRVEVTTPAGTTACSLAAADVTVNVTAETLSDGVTTVPCPALDFTDDVSGPYTVAVRNGTAATGSYEFVGRGESIHTTPAQYAGGGDPTATYGVARATIRVAYADATVRYTSEPVVTEADAHA